MKSPPLFRRIFFHNLGLKIVSLLLAIGLWLAVTTNSSPAEIESRVPIEFRHPPENLEIASSTTTEVRVLVRGPERIIRRLRSTDVMAEVDLAGVVPGERTFDISARNIHVPPDVEVVQVDPPQFQISFDTRQTRTVPIRPRVTGNFASGLRIAQVTVEPSTVVISGPSGHVQQVEAATTDPVNASGTLNSATFVTQTYVSDPLVQVVRPAPVRVTVTMGKQ